jgi:hypothetical protein
MVTMKKLMRWAALAVMMVMSGLPAHAEGSVRAFFFGNSLIHHLTESDETTVPHWLALLAEAGGHDFRADGTWGFPHEFPQALPPPAEWEFDAVSRALEEGQRWTAGKFDTIIYNPTNFLHYDPPTRPLGGNPSVVEMTAEVLGWTAANAPGAVHYIYEGWSNMEGLADYPPSDRGMRRYHAFQQGEYHDWYLEYVAALREALPEVDIRLIPVAPVLAEVLTQTRLAEIPAVDVYSDQAPHGTATKYLLAAMVVHAVIWNEVPPRIDLPETVHPVLRAHYDAVAAAIWTAVTGAVWPEGVEPFPIPAGGPEQPALGMGLAGIADWSAQVPFIDQMKSARPWVAHTPDTWGAWSFEDLQAGGHLGEGGWVTEMPAGADRVETFILNEMPAAARSLAGRYLLTWEGRGEIDVWGRVERVDARPTRISFDYAPGPGAVVLTLHEIDPADPIRNIRVVREDHLPLVEAGEIFNPDWLRLVEGFRSLRFMDWMDSNHSTQADWAERPLPGDFSWAWRGVPVEVMVALANRAGADPWFNMPHLATDDYVRGFAGIVRDGLRPGLVAWVEYSNEVWNFQFGQSQWAIEAARERWGTEENGAWMQLMGLRAAEVMGIWTEVFGAEAEARLVRVIGLQAGWMGLEEAALEAPLVQAEGLPAPHEAFDAYAITGYFGGELVNEETERQVTRMMGRRDPVARAVEMIEDGSFEQLVEEIFPYHAEVAARYGLQLVAYEGGTHAVAYPPLNEDEALVDFLNEVNYSPELAALYARMLAEWQAVGGGLFTVYLDVQMPSRWGAWGTLRHLDDMTARWATVAAHNAAMPVDWEDRDPAVFRGEAP